MNVTVGLPRIIEILDGRKSIKTPMMEIFLKKPYSKGKDIKRLALSIKETTLKDIAAELSVNINDKKVSVVIDKEKMKEIGLTLSQVASSLQKQVKGVNIKKTDEGVVNTSAVNITAKRDVLVESGYFSEATVKASADDASVSNTATVAINATGENGDEEDGNVEIVADGLGSNTKVVAEATDSPDNTAGVTVNAAGDVDIHVYDGEVSVKAIADPPVEEYDVLSNTANVDITGANINIVSEYAGPWIDLPDDAIVYAYAADGNPLPGWPIPWQPTASRSKPVSAS